ncbi:ribonuclease P [Candidatus Woesearchaeota archaeon]|nr:ribonuclease P [Candidatus Woesearchaeota archaeon]
MKKNIDPEKQKKLAVERMEILFKKAEDVFTKNAERANRYIAIARRIAMKMNIRLTKIQKRHFCKHCYSFLLSGVNATNRTRNGKIITYCKVCKKYTRIPLTKRKL